MMSIFVMPSPPWAKLGPLGGAASDRLWLSLIDHSADVAAVFEAMLRVPVVAQRLARLAGQDDFPQVWRDRLAVYVALHDFGKANRGFQARRDPTARIVGHVGPGLALLYSDTKLAQRLCDVLPFADLATWSNEKVVEAALRAVAAHHGRPITQHAIAHAWTNDLNNLWAATPDYDPISTLQPLAQSVSSWFPAAFEKGGVPLPDAPQFWHAFAGLVMLADWIGSDATSFPLQQKMQSMN